MNYKKIRSLIFVAFFMLSLAGCQGSSEPANDPPGTGDEDILEISLDAGNAFQTIHNFGASDAWSIQFVGKNWPVEQRDRIADLLFSLGKKEDGSPAGIGLSAWRFNIGGGSAEQGSASGITDEWRRAESFIDQDEQYDPTRQTGQLWFLKAAKERGVEHFTGFVNSPPVVYTKNGKAWSDNGVSSNLAENNYTKYADFLSNVVKIVTDQAGVTFDNVSPFNEPQWEWKCCGQEGSPWNNLEIAKAVRAIDASFDRNNVPSKIEVTEAGQLEYLFGTKSPTNRSDQVYQFFSPSSDNYIGDLASVAPKIAGHSYFTTWDLERLVSTRQALRQKLESVDPALEYWMSEYTLLEDNDQVKGPGRDLGMDPALYLSRVIQADLVIAQASAWQWWLAVSPYDYKDGLVYIDHNKFDGAIYTSKLLWALGHFSRFIRPGSVRIDVKRSDNKAFEQVMDQLLVSAYRSQSGDELIVVFTNQLSKDQSVRISGFPSTMKTLEVYQTTSQPGEDLTRVLSAAPGDEITIPKRGLVTCIIK